MGRLRTHGRTVRLLVEDEQNRRLLAEMLGDEYAVEVGTDGEGLAEASFDLCLLDHRALRKHYDGLAERTAAEAPVILPCLLLCNDRVRAEANATTYEVVDEVATTPIRRARLRNRIETLLDHRAQSLELQRQNERLERFASLVSHDLYSPLTVATGRLELARDETDSDHLAAVAEAHDRVDELITDILSLTRQGKAIDGTETVDLAVLAERSWEMVEAPEATLDVDGTLSFEADASRVQQLFENLFRNAVEHGGEAVAIGVGPLDDGRGFYVEDDGPGVPVSDREVVFEYTFTTSETNTGFGLAIVDQIAGAHGWTIRVDDGARGGARFEVCFD